MSFDPSTAAPEESFDPTSAAPDSAPPLSMVLRAAVRENPDEAAEAARLAKRYPIPEDVVARNLRDVQFQEAVDKIDEKLKTSPKLAEYMRANSTAAKQSHDSVPQLSALEQALNASRAFTAGPVNAIGQGVSGLGEVVDVLARGSGLTGLSRFIRDKTGADPAKVFDVATSLKTIGGGWEMLGTAVGPDAKDANFVTDVAGGVGQLAGQVGLAMSGAGAATLPLMFGQGVDAANKKTKDDVAPQWAKDLNATLSGGVTLGTEKLGLDAIMNRVPPKIKNDAVRWVADKMAAFGIEFTQETAEAVGQDLLRKVLTNPDAKIGEGFAYEGSVAGTSAAIVRAALGVKVRSNAQIQQGKAAEQSADNLKQQLDLATQAPLRERNPEEFRNAVAAMSDGAEVFVDAGVLNQLAPEMLAQMPQSVQDQLANQVTQDTAIAVPVADVLTIAPGTPLAQFFTENARMDGPGSMSQVEAKDAGAKAQEYLAQESQRVIQQATDQQAMQESSDRVKQGMLDQLNTVGRFRKDVNEAYATWTAAFYTTMAGRQGLTPEEMQAKYPLRITGQSGQGSVLNAGTKPGEMQVEGYHFSAADRSTLSTAFYGTQYAGSAKDEILNHPDKRIRQRLSFYFDKGTGIRPESGVGGRAHRVQLSGVYDADADPLKLKGGDARAFESKLLDAGYTGYANRMDGTQPGQVIMLGEQTFTPEKLGAISRIDTGQRVAPLETSAPQWQTQASGEPEVLQAKLERMQTNASWADYDLRIEGRDLQVREKGGIVSNQSATGEVNGRLEQAGNGSGRPTGGSLAPLEGAPAVPGFNGPDPRVVAVAERYAADNGIDLKRQAEYVQVDPERATRIAAAYEAMAHNPQDPAVKEAYDNLIRQTLAQYRALEAAGYKFWFTDLSREDNQDYTSSPWNAMRDMRANQQMGVFPTTDGFGTSAEFNPENNPLFADTGLQWPVGGINGELKPVLANDLFRAVHDAFGHGMEGAGFRAQGEENAWQAHSRLFTGSALGAITTETRGQNSWLNFGPHGERNQGAKVEDTVFADQKTGLMPEWTWTEGRAGDQSEDINLDNLFSQNTAPQTDTPEFKAWSNGHEVVPLGDFHEFKDGEGVVVNVLHGTTGDFDTFDQSKANIESDLGAGFYFTNTPTDVSTNYAGEGPDLTNKIQRLAEQIAGETDREYNAPEVVAEAKQQLSVQHGGMSMPVFVRFDNPAVLGGDGETFLNYEEAYNEETDEYEEPTGKLVDFVEALRDVAGEYSEVDVDGAMAEVWESANDDQGIKITALIEKLKASEGLQYATDDNGTLASTEIIRKALEQMGYDGFIDQTVNDKFGPKLRRNGETYDRAGGMQGMDESTVHFIAFNPAQIKSAIGNNGEFNPNDPNILKQGPRGTFNPKTLELALNENADLSTFLHETGHFFLEVMADLSNQPDAPADIQADMGKLMKWFGVADTATWNAMTLDQKRPYHERFAESFEQYLMEGKAPSLELQPLFRKFRAWMLNVYKSLKAFIDSRVPVTSGGEGLNQPAYHGTPHRGIDKFSTDKIGTGEGAQAYGWGLYFAGKKEIAEWYRNKLSDATVDVADLKPAPKGSTADKLVRLFAKNRVLDAKDLRAAGVDPDNVNLDDSGEIAVGRFIDEGFAAQDSKDLGDGKYLFTFEDGSSFLDDQGDIKAVSPVRGQLYEVDIPEDSEMLLWDKPLSEQPEKVRKALEPFTAPAEKLTWASGNNGDYKYFNSADKRYSIADRASGAELQYRTDSGTTTALGDFKNAAAAKKAAQEHADNLAANMAGADFYTKLTREQGSDKAVSEYLAKLGIKGIKYLDGTSRNAGDGSYNYVVFSGDDVAVKNQFYQDPNAAPGANIQLSDEVRQVFDRMLASEEQIAQANEVAGLLPNEEADAEANEKLTARSLRDLKWTVNARAKEIKKLQAQAKALRKDVQAEVTAEVEAMPEFQAKDMLDKTRKENKQQLNDTELAIIADAFAYPDVDTMLKAIDAAGKKADVIEGMTDQRMLERHGDLIDQRAIEEAANEAVHNMARAKSLATELKAQADMLNPRADTGEVNAKGQKITVNALVEAAKQFATNVVSKTPLRDLKNKAWQHTAAERRAGKRWQEATAKGQTQEAVQAKQDQMLNNAAAKAALDAQGEMRKILDFFKRVIKDNNEKVVDKGRDPDVVNAARAVLSAYGVAPKAGKTALEYMALVEKNDPAMYEALQPSVQGALNMAQPLDSLTMDELRGLHEEIQGMWHLAKRSRQMEVDGNMMDMQDAEDELQARMQVLGVPLTMPGDTSAVTKAEERVRKLQGVRALLTRVEQWAQGMGAPFTRLVFLPVKEAANRYRADRVKYRKAYQALVDNVAPAMTKGRIEAPELGYTFGEGHNGIGHAELLHAILHTGNESNKRKLLLGRKWATENEDGTLDTARWDAFLKRAHDTGILTKVHYDFAQGVWDLLEQTKPLAQKTHRDVFGRYFAEITADSFDTPFGNYKGGYVPAQADPRIVQDADMRKLTELENENMAFSFPSTNKGFTKGRVEYNRPLMLDLRTIGQHLDKVLLFSHMEPAVRDVNKLLSRKGVSYSLGRISPAAYSGMLTPWLSRSARQIVETPVVGDGGISRVLSAARSRAGMALMFANVSNSLQQVTGFSTAFAKLKADGLQSHMMAATAQFIASPKKTAQAVSDASIFMASRMENEIAAINDAMDEILLNPGLYAKAQAWSQKHAYFMQTAIANTMEPIIWTAGYNSALEKTGDEKEAVRYADSLIRTTQGSTLPEDVSRIETGPAYARVFTQFIGYFNMIANTNATALKQISQEVGLKRGAGKALGVVTLGLLIPIWVAEAIAQAMRGGPEDEDKDGYLDDWLAAVFGFGTIKGTFAMVPFVGSLANAGINRFNGNPADDKMSLSPAVSLLEAAVGVPVDVYKAITDPGKLNTRNAVRDVASAVSLATGLPAVALARPLGYAAAVEQGKVNPTGPVDMARGLVTGTPSPGSK